MLEPIKPEALVLSIREAHDLVYRHSVSKSATLGFEVMFMAV